MCGICSSKGNPQLDRFPHLFPGSAAGRQPLNMLQVYRIYVHTQCHAYMCIFFHSYKISRYL